MIKEDIIIFAVLEMFLMIFSFIVWAFTFNNSILILSYSNWFLFSALLNIHDIIVDLKLFESSGINHYQNSRSVK